MTKSILHYFILCFCLLFLISCNLMKDTSSNFTIKVCGTKGLKFSGHYSILGADALSEPVNAHGIIPMEYKGKGVIALCSFRKLIENGSLKVEIMKDGKIVSESETSIPYGFVSLKTSIPEKNTIIAQIVRKVFGNE